ncbi:hypothetical protein [Methyloglobulus morosus]|uniref:hypothetical protein n=1 Tax=Methyloglobulus morosus TaxID=1410681 RepID=UPI00137A4C39|nr:hypothetical protein [Methyloglobulus morosus]
MSKEKYPKETTPGCRLLPAFLSFDGGCRKGLPVPPATCGIPAAPLRAIPAKTSGTRRGITGYGDCRSIVGWIRRAKQQALMISEVILRVVIHHVEVHHIRWVTPRINTSFCLVTVRLRG